MPTYQYQCKNCGHELDEFQSISEPPLTLCPVCRKESLVRILGGGYGIIFKGTGFYLTDYKKASSPPAAKQEGPKNAPAGDTKTDKPH